MHENTLLLYSLLSLNNYVISKKSYNTLLIYIKFHHLLHLKYDMIRTTSVNSYFGVSSPELTPTWNSLLLYIICLSESKGEKVCDDNKWRIYG